MNSQKNQVPESTNNHKNDDKKWLQSWWIQYHYDSLRADERPDLNLEFCERLKYHSIIFPCEKCKPHFQSYLKNNPPENASSLFVYTWKFHNDVNVRLNKPTMDFDTYQKIYKVEGYKCKTCSLSYDKNNSLGQDDNHSLGQDLSNMTIKEPTIPRELFLGD